MASDSSDDNTCQLCEPAPHPNCQSYTMLTVSDPMTGSEATVDVCLEHYDALKKVIA